MDQPAGVQRRWKSKSSTKGTKMDAEQRCVALGKILFLLRGYARHLPDCKREMPSGPCTCGFEMAFRRATEIQREMAGARDEHAHA